MSPPKGTGWRAVISLRKRQAKKVRLRNPAWGKKLMCHILFFSFSWCEVNQLFLIRLPAKLPSPQLSLSPCKTVGIHMPFSPADNGEYLALGKTHANLQKYSTACSQLSALLGGVCAGCSREPEDSNFDGRTLWGPRDPPHRVLLTKGSQPSWLGQN